MTVLCTYENQMQFEFKLNETWSPMENCYWLRVRAIEQHSQLPQTYRDVGRTFQRIPIKTEHVKHVVAFCNFAQFESN